MLADTFRPQSQHFVTIILGLKFSLNLPMTKSLDVKKILVVSWTLWLSSQTSRTESPCARRWTRSKYASDDRWTAKAGMEAPTRHPTYTADITSNYHTMVRNAQAKAAACRQQDVYVTMLKSRLQQHHTNFSILKTFCSAAIG